jgi:hypothetical protein
MAGTNSSPAHTHQPIAAAHNMARNATQRNATRHTLCTQGTGKMQGVGAEDWTRQTIDSWRHSNLVGVLDPWYVVFKWNPKLWYKVTREIVTLERMHQAFDKGLMQYGLMRGTKKAAVGSSSSSSSSASSSSSSSSQQPAAAAAGST